MAQRDPDGKTFLYILYLENLQLDPSAVDYVGSEAAIFWYVGDGEQYHSSQTMVLTKDPVRYTYCSFYSITMPNLPDRSLNVTMTLSVNDEHIGVAFLDFKDFGESDDFKSMNVKLLTDAGVLAEATLFTASQARWSFSEPIEANTAGFFVDHTADDQAKQLHEHIFPEEADTQEQDKAEAEAQKAKEEEARKREAEREEKRREDERREAERKREQDDREKEAARRAEEERRREEDRRARDLDERRRAEDRDETDRRDRQRRWEEEEEAERRRREDFDRRKKEFLDTAPDKSSSAPLNDPRRKERQQWEEDRERLKRDARRLREREMEELERRAEDRRRQIEAREPKEAPRETTSHRRGSASHSKSDSRNGRGKYEARGAFPAQHEESDVSEEITFDGEDEEEVHLRKGSRTTQKGASGGNFQWPRRQGAPGRQRQGQQLVLRPGMQVSSPPAELSLAERLEHFRSQAALNRLGGQQREMVVESSSGPVAMLESIEVAGTKGEGVIDGQSGSRSVNTTPRKKFSLRKGDEGRKANAVLSAVLQDATGSNFALGGSVAQMEEAVLRLLVLHKELANQDEAPQTALADATAGLAPRMVQVLQAAKAVCEANRQKLNAYTEEKQLGIDRSDYLAPQMQAIDKLQQQFSTLIPGHSVPEDRCDCGADFSADANFCRLCGRRRQRPTTHTPPRTAPSSARFSPRMEGGMAPLLQPLQIQAPSLSSSPPSARQPGYVPSAGRNEAPRPDRPVDPGLPDSQLPTLRGGSPVHPRRSLEGLPNGATMATPRSEVSSIAAPWSGPEYRVRRVNVPAIPHWDRHHLEQVRDSETTTAVMWDAVAATLKTSPRPAQLADAPVEPVAAAAAAAASPLWDAVAGVACGSQLRSPRMPAQVGAPLRTAMQQVRGVADELSRPRSRGRGTGGGAHAGAGSPSPRQEPETQRPPEDKYLKILQSLQAKGAMNGSGLAAQLWEKQGLRRRIRDMQADTDSDSSDLRT